MRIVRVAAVLLAVAFGASAVALAVERPAKQEDDEPEAPERVVTVSGILAKDGKGFTVAGRELGLGPPWWRESGKAADFDGDGTVEAVAAELASLVGKSVSVTGAAEDGDGDLSVRTIAGKAFREQGRPPWAGGPKRDARCAAKASADKTKHGHGPPPWARALGRRAC